MNMRCAASVTLAALLICVALPGAAADVPLDKRAPLGQKLIKTLPAVMADSFAAGQRWGAELGPEIGRRVQARFEEEGIAL